MNCTQWEQTCQKWTRPKNGKVIQFFLDLSIFQNGQLSIFQIQCNFELSQFDFWGEKLSPAHFLGHLSILKNGPVQKNWTTCPFSASSIFDMNALTVLKVSHYFKIEYGHFQTYKVTFDQEGVELERKYFLSIYLDILRAFMSKMDEAENGQVVQFFLDRSIF